MTDREKRIEAMLFLETLVNREDLDDASQALAWGAHYLVHSMLYGVAPENYDEVIKDARNQCSL
jgi:hypothetical protein